MATALQRLIPFSPQTQDKPRKGRVLSCGPICHDCGCSAHFYIGPDSYCGPCSVRLATGSIMGNR